MSFLHSFSSRRAIRRRSFHYVDFDINEYEEEEEKKLEKEKSENGFSMEEIPIIISKKKEIKYENVEITKKFCCFESKKIYSEPIQQNPFSKYSVCIFFFF